MLSVSQKFKEDIYEALQKPKAEFYERIYIHSIIKAVHHPLKGPVRCYVVFKIQNPKYIVYPDILDQD